MSVDLHYASQIVSAPSFSGSVECRAPDPLGQNGELLLRDMCE